MIGIEGQNILENMLKTANDFFKKRMIPNAYEIYEHLYSNSEVTYYKIMGLVGMARCHIETFTEMSLEHNYYVLLTSYKIITKSMILFTNDFNKQPQNEKQSTLMRTQMYHIRNVTDELFMRWESIKPR